MTFELNIPDGVQTTWGAAMLDQARLQQQREEYREYEKKKFAEKQAKGAELEAQGVPVEFQYRLAPEYDREREDHKYQISRLKYENEVKTNMLPRLYSDLNWLKRQLNYKRGAEYADVKERLDAKQAEIDELEREQAENKKAIDEHKKAIDKLNRNHSEKIYIF